MDQLPPKSYNVFEGWCFVLKLTGVLISQSVNSALSDCLLICSALSGNIPSDYKAKFPMTHHIKTLPLSKLPQRHRYGAGCFIEPQLSDPYNNMYGR